MMQSILIVDPAEGRREALAEELQKRYHVICCEDGTTGLELLQEYSPDGLILNLSLHGMDGLFFLESAVSFLPKAVITLSSIYPFYTEQILTDLGVTHRILIPCTTHSIIHRMHDMLTKQHLLTSLNSQKAVEIMLMEMQAPDWGGKEMVRVGVPLFAQDRSQRMMKDFYSNVAVLCNCDNPEQVESSIRRLKCYIWENCTAYAREKYFYGMSRRPTNRQFISRLADFLDK